MSCDEEILICLIRSGNICTRFFLQFITDKPIFFCHILIQSWTTSTILRSTAAIVHKRVSPLSGLRRFARSNAAPSSCGYSSPLSGKEKEWEKGRSRRSEKWETERLWKEEGTMREREKEISPPAPPLTLLVVVYPPLSASFSFGIVGGPSTVSPFLSGSRLKGP